MKIDIILVASKSEHISRICEFLCRAHINVLCIETVHETRAGLTLYSPAFILLDLDIRDSKYLLAEIAYGDFASQPYIIATSNFSNSGERAAILRQGADVCIEKPISGEEVLALIGAVLRHKERSAQLNFSIPLPYIKYKELTIDFPRRNVTMHGRSIALTRKEFDVLCVLAKRAGTVLSKKEIYTAVWKSEYNPKSTHVSDQISSLRHKLGLNRNDIDYIQTVIGVGYRFGTSI